MTVTFLGHGDLAYDNRIENEVIECVEGLINNGADRFFLGGYGNYDSMCARVVNNLRGKYPQIKSYLVIPYLNKKYDTVIYDDTIYPPIENIPLRFAIVKRNEWMIDNSEIVVAYVMNSAGDAAKSVLYAQRKNKIVINIAGLD